MENYWFIYDSYKYAGAPKMEKAVMAVAETYMHRLIKEDDLPKLVAHLNKIQDMVWEDNKRLKKVDIRLSVGKYWRNDNIIYLYIGDQRLTLKKVAGTMRFED